MLQGLAIQTGTPGSVLGKRIEEPEDATLSITTCGTLGGIKCVVGRADAKSLRLEQTAWDILPRNAKLPPALTAHTTSNHLLDSHAAFSCTVCQPHPPIGSCPRPWSHFAATSHFSARLARCSSPMLTGSPGQTERHSLSGLVRAAAASLRGHAGVPTVPKGRGWRVVPHEMQKISRTPVGFGPFPDGIPDPWMPWPWLGKG